MIFKSKELSKYRDYLRYEKDSSENSIKAYMADINLFLDFLDISEESFDPSTVSKDDVRSWIMKMRESGTSARSINRRITALKGFYKWALSEKIVSVDPVSTISKMKESRYLPSFIREGDMQKILDDVSISDISELSPDERYQKVLSYILILSLYTTGFRRSELLNLKYSDIDFGLKTIKIIGKGNKQRIVPIIPELEEAFHFYEKEKNTFFKNNYDKNFVFLWSSGEPLSYYHMLTIVKMVLQGEGIKGKLSPHLLRHTFASHLLRAGAEITAIKELLGHSSLVTTQVYTHNTIDELKDVYRNAHPRAKED